MCDKLIYLDLEWRNIQKIYMKKLIVSHIGDDMFNFFLGTHSYQNACTYRYEKLKA